jgi:Ca-activated chloride channel family protein
MRSVVALICTLLVLIPLSSDAFAFSSAAPDSTGTITGRVTDANKGQPLPGANVTIDSLSLGTATGKQGQFRLSNVPAGTHIVSVSFVGYSSTQKTVTVEAGKTIQISFALSPTAQDMQDMDEVVVTSYGRAPGQVRQRARPSQWNTEDYAPIESNDFRAVSDHPLSTFAIDVDGASYTNTRRFIRDGERPPKDAVRIEEFLNYFQYDYPAPAAEDEHPFAATMEAGPAPWHEKHRLVHVGIQGQRVPRAERPPSNLVFLVDVSGSMRSPRKLPLLKKGFRMLAEQLRPEDRVAMVVYAGSSGIVLESTPGTETDSIKQAITRLEAGGSTAGAAGIRQAYQVAEEHFIEDGINRVILATDGDFNVGVSSDGALQRLVERKRESGTALTVLGFGTGNIKDNKMETLANHGNGNYYYVDSATEARRVLVDQLGSTLQTIAKDVKVQVEFNPAEVAAYRLIGYVNRQLEDEEFADDSTDAGELGAGHSVTALYDVIPRGVESEVDVPTVGDLKYQETQPSDAAEASDELLTLKLRYKEPDGDESQLIERPLTQEAANREVSPDFSFAAAVAGYGMLLRDSEYKGSLTLDAVRRLAEQGRGEDPNGTRAGFISLVEDTRGVLAVSPPGEEGNPSQ